MNVIQKDSLQCKFCYNPCWKYMTIEASQLTIWHCDRCPYDVSYNLHWGDEEPSSYSIYLAYKENNYCITIQYRQKRWKLSSMEGNGITSWGKEVLCSGFFDEPPDINPGNARDKLLFYLTFS